LLRREIEKLISEKKLFENQRLLSWQALIFLCLF